LVHWRRGTSPSISYWVIAGLCAVLLLFTLEQRTLGFEVGVVTNLHTVIRPRYSGSDDIPHGAQHYTLYTFDLKTKSGTFGRSDQAIPPSRQCVEIRRGILTGTVSASDANPESCGLQRPVKSKMPMSDKDVEQELESLEKQSREIWHKPAPREPNGLD
jgi:hypothetical protein